MQAKGTAMSEMILVVPFLLTVLAYVFFFGRGMVRVQRAQVMDRYEVWRQVGRAPGGIGTPNPGYTEPGGANGPQLNDTFFAGNAISVNDSGETWSYFPDDAPQELVQQLSSFSGDAAALAEEAHEAFPKGRSVGFSAGHEERIPLWKPFQGTIRHRHTRLDNEWKFANDWDNFGPTAEQSGGGPWMMPEIRDVFIEDFDGMMENLENGGNYIAKRIRWIYLRKPSYRGPEIK
jgi:hypothetical protein